MGTWGRHITGKGHICLHWQFWVLHAGVVEGLLQQHKWPHGFDEDREWLGEATEAIRDITARHVKQARVSGTPLDEHMRNVLAVPG